MIFCTLIGDGTISHSLSSELYCLSLHIKELSESGFFSRITGSAVQYETIRYILPPNTIGVGAIAPKNMIHGSLMYGDVNETQMHFYLKFPNFSP